LCIAESQTLTFNTCRDITVNFGEAKGNIDLSELIADSDIEKGKSILYMENWPKEVERLKILFVPKNEKRSF